MSCVAASLVIVDNRHDTVCEDTGPAIENGYGNAVYSNCEYYHSNIDKLDSLDNTIGCCDTVCPNSDIIDDDEVSADDLNVTWLAHNHEQATLIVNWTISSSGKHYYLIKLAIDCARCSSIASL